jgi:predicted GIY-YIG superfamily endonuclease
METAANWSVFILRNPAGRCFVGHTQDLPGFLAGADADVANWTGQPGPWPLVWRHDGLTEAAARKYEVSLKRDRDTPRFYTRTGLTPPAPAAEAE